MTVPVVRPTTRHDIPAILALYPRAFPGEDLTPLVSSLLYGDAALLSLVTVEAERVAAHILFTACGTGDDARAGALLGPLGVVPDRQRRGIGSGLVREGLERLGGSPTRQVFVLGDPGYYRRFGFAPERRIDPPFPIPDEWADGWQSLSLSGRPALPTGRLLVPEPWMAPGLWSP